MIKFAKNSLCSKMSFILAVVMLLPFIASAVCAAEKPAASPIIISNTPDDFKISSGRGENMEVGTKGIITRSGKEIAKFEVTSVEWGYSRITISDLKSGESIRLGDSASITDPAKTSGKKIKKKSNSNALLAVLLVGALVAMGGKGGGGGSNGGNSSGSSSIDLSAQNTSLPANGTSSTTVTADIVDKNNLPVPDGTIVQFSSNTGVVNPVNAQTIGGRAITTLTSSNTTGVCVVTATVGNATKSLNLNFVPGDSAQGTIELSASPESIQVEGSGGQSESIITAVCKDGSSNPAQSGTVTFTSTLGSVVGSAQIGEDGVATSTFRSNTIGQAEITANWSSTQASVSVRVTAGPPHSVLVECTPASVECDGNSFAVITATVKDIAGNNVTDGTVVSFSVQPDAKAGGNGSITPKASTVNGIATANLFTRPDGGTKSNPGTATIVAQVKAADQPAGIPVPVQNLMNNATDVQFISMDVAFINIAARPLNIRGWDYIGRTSTVTAIAYDSQHNPVPDGTAVYFTPEYGMMYGNSGSAGKVAVSITKNGIAEATLVSDAAQVGDGRVDVTATSGTQTITVPDLVIFSGAPYSPLCSAEIEKYTYEPLNDNGEISIRVFDLNNNPVIDGTPIYLKATKGAFESAVVKTAGGCATALFMTSTDVLKPTPSGGGKITVTIGPQTGEADATVVYEFAITVL